MAEKSPEGRRKYCHIKFIADKVAEADCKENYC